MELMMISDELFDEMTKSVVAMDIAEQRNIKKIVQFNSNEYVLTSCRSSAKHGYITVSGHMAIPINKYRENLQPLSYNEHLIDRLEGNREVGYHAMRIQTGTRELVMVDPLIEFFPVRNLSLIAEQYQLEDTNFKKFFSTC